MSVASIDDVRAALDIMSARVPDRHVSIGDAEVSAFYVDLGRFPRAVLFRAAREWGAMHFPSAGELLNHVLDVARATAAEEQAEFAAGTLGLRKCPDGCDNGWFDEAPHQHIGVMRPCERCKPVEHAMWKHRRTPDHDEDHCGDCIGLRSRPPRTPRWLEDAKAGTKAF